MFDAIILALWLLDPIPTLPTERECQENYGRAHAIANECECDLERMGFLNRWHFSERARVARRQADLWWAAWWVRWPQATPPQRHFWAGEIRRLLE